MKIAMILEKSRAPSENVFRKGLGWGRTGQAACGLARLTELLKLGLELRPILIRELDGGVDVGHALRRLGLHVPGAKLVQLVPESTMGFRALGELSTERYSGLLQQEILEITHCSHTISSSRYWITTMPSWQGLSDLHSVYHDSDAVENSILRAGSQAQTKTSISAVYGSNLMNSMIKIFLFCF